MGLLEDWHRNTEALKRMKASQEEERPRVEMLPWEVEQLKCISEHPGSKIVRLNPKRIDYRESAERYPWLGSAQAQEGLVQEWIAHTAKVEQKERQLFEQRFRARPKELKNMTREQWKRYESNNCYRCGRHIFYRYVIRGEIYGKDCSDLVPGRIEWTNASRWQP